MQNATLSMPGTNRRSAFRSRILAGLLNRLGRIGVRIQLFLLVREGASPNVATIASDPRFTSGFIGAEDIPELVRVEPFVDAGKCADRLRRGLVCYAVKDGSRIVAKMWCDLEEVNFPPARRRLEDREAYLFSAYTDPTYRGQNLAPFMRLNCYGALRALGRNSFLSYTEFFNTAARRFKAKLGAKDESLCVHVALFGYYSHTFTLRRYTTQP